MNTLVVSNTLLNAGDDVTFQALIGDEFRAARGLTLQRRLGDALCVAESAMSASLRQSEEEKCPRL
jgi:hypothetical protein